MHWKQKMIYNNEKYHTLLIDCRIKNNNIRYLSQYATTIIRVLWNFDKTIQIYDGWFISNGPGIPMICQATIWCLRRMLENDKPVFGIFWLVSLCRWLPVLSYKNFCLDIADTVSQCMKGGLMACGTPRKSTDMPYSTTWFLRIESPLFYTL